MKLVTQYFTSLKPEEISYLTYLREKQKLRNHWINDQKEYLLIRQNLPC